MPINFNALLQQGRADSLNAGLAAASQALLAPVGVGRPNPNAGFGAALGGFTKAVHGGNARALQQAIGLQNAQIGQQRLAIAQQRQVAAERKEKQTALQELQARSTLLGDGADPESPNQGAIAESSLSSPTKAALRGVAEQDPVAAGKLLANLQKGKKPIIRNVDGQVTAFDPDTLEEIKVLGAAGDPTIKSLVDIIGKQSGKARATKAAASETTLRDRMGAVGAMANLTNNAARVVSAHGGNVLSVVRGGRAFLQGAQGQINAIIRGNEEISSDVKASAAGRGEFKLFNKVFGNLVGEGAAFKSTMINLAILKARAEEKGRLSDPDIERALAQVGGGASSKEEALGAMFASMRNSVSRIENDIDFSNDLVKKNLGSLGKAGAFRKMISSRLGNNAESVFSGNIFGVKKAAGPPKVGDRTMIGGKPFTVQIINGQTVAVPAQ